MRSTRILCSLVIVISAGFPSARADEKGSTNTLVPVEATSNPSATTEGVDAAPDVDHGVRATAIALNYCRASFHRIRKYPSTPVLHEEQEKILNNLNLQGIEDPEVIALYTSVLDEINQIQVADKERELTHLNHGTNMQRKMTWDLLAFGTDLATLQYGNALRNGANSWWDHRNMTYQRDSDVLKIEKQRMQSVTQKSSTFLDTFWKLARRKNIPDRWLVRGNDLDDLEVALAEKDPEVRLRILKRMEPYMQAYPPYSYYVARTEQELGDFIAATKTYEQLAIVGDGHFRKDDMLATSLANLATIQEHLGDRDAVITARRALEYSTEVWEANLLCARILQRHQQFAQAEDAILRNLDVGIETGQSRVFLASLYYHNDERAKLAKFLENDDVVASLPAPVLLRCAASLGVEQTPASVMRTVMASLHAQPRTQLGRSELLVRMSPTWQLHLARVDVLVDGKSLRPVPVEQVAGGHQLRYSGRFDIGTSLTGPVDHPDVAVRFTYPDETVVNVTFHANDAIESGASTPLNIRSIARRPSTDGIMAISRIDVAGKEVALQQSVSRVAPLELRPFPTSTLND